MNAEPSRWRDDATWVERLEGDRVVLEQNIGDEGMETLAEVLRVTSEGLGRPDFVVVFGSRARQAGDDESDVDLCFEASWVPADPERMPRIRERQNELVFDMMAFPRGRPLSDLLAEQLGGTTSSVLRIVEEPATEFVAGRLGIDVGTPTVLAEYVIDDASARRLAYSLEWVPIDLVSRQTLVAKFEDSALSTLIAVGIRPWRGRLALSATTAGRHRSRLLQVPATAAIILLESTIVDGNERAVLVAKHHLRPDIVQLSLPQDP